MSNEDNPARSAMSVLHGHGFDVGRFTHRHYRGAEDHDHDSEGNAVFPERPNPDPFVCNGCHTSDVAGFDHFWDGRYGKMDA
jgi:hypothetical protein